MTTTKILDIGIETYLAPLLITMRDGQSVRCGINDGVWVTTDVDGISHWVITQAMMCIDFGFAASKPISNGYLKPYHKLTLTPAGEALADKLKAEYVAWMKENCPENFAAMKE